eukprot:SAG31_NODE_1375_length_8594_cov_2.810477_4_plen_72_part_00
MSTTIYSVALRAGQSSPRRGRAAARDPAAMRSGPIPRARERAHFRFPKFKFRANLNIFKKENPQIGDYGES